MKKHHQPTIQHQNIISREKAAIERQPFFYNLKYVLEKQVQI